MINGIAPETAITADAAHVSKVTNPDTVYCDAASTSVSPPSDAEPAASTVGDVTG